MMFLIHAVIHGMCCDYGWGIHGNEQIWKVEAPDREAARQKAIKNYVHDDSEIKLKSLTVYEISNEEVIDHKTVLAKMVQDYEEQAAAEAKAAQEARDLAEYERLQAKFGAKK